MDVAASEFYRFDKYGLDFKSPGDSSRLTRTSPSSRSIQWYPLKTPFDQMTGKLGRSCQLVQACWWWRMILQ
ncbi:rCG61523 [Rattus norvegicus]|uniref:RCG61523 n=1 Tax=Rattus norvegicus TaxID=10116 RepID=A6H9A5_RAT|nr:rCG61523 [Rattus norvegicus]